ncbi:MAG: hypothetical protein A2X49_08525 [Lentisphaerae bacterium GWF2_52_8]|nr:MAG: hypothetical protein A2X49_08525 [Lentisphaerae bacterium GWF2_52_8]
MPSTTDIETISLPGFMAACHATAPRPAQLLSSAGGKSFHSESGGIRFEAVFSGMYPAPLEYRGSCAHVVLLGSPIIAGRIDPTLTMSMLANNDIVPVSTLASLNGEFLIFRFDKSDNSLTIINDRFTSFPCYYWHDRSSGAFYATPQFCELWDLMYRKGKLRLWEETFFEFLWFQRVLGTKTCAEGASFLPDASVLEFKNTRVSMFRYWQRNYAKTKLSQTRCAAALGDAMKQSVGRKTSDGRCYGHFLSGGLASRLALAAFPQERTPVCFTAALGPLSLNARAARRMANLRGAEHVLLEIAPDCRARFLQEAARISGGMLSCDSALFFGQQDKICSHADVACHGHGFGSFFEGVCLPTQPARFAGKNLQWGRLQALPDLDMFCSHFIAEAPFRTRNADIWRFIHEKDRKRLREFQEESVQEVLRLGEDLTEDPYDIWEYMCCHHFSRHWDYPLCGSIGTMIEQRCLSYDNELFDLALSMPAKYRVNARVAREALMILDKRLAKIRHPGTNLPLASSFMKHTFYELAGYVRHSLSSTKGEHPQFPESAWRSREHAFRQDPALRIAAETLAKSETLAQLSFLDMGKLKKSLRSWLDGHSNNGLSGDLVQALLSVDAFLDQ